MEEENFPRGGVKEKTKTEERPKTVKSDADLFQESQESKGQKRKREKKEKGDEKKKQSAKKHKIEGKVSGQIESFSPEVLSYKHVYTGMTMLGCIKTIHRYDMVVALPNGLSGTVSITNISRAYTESLQKYSQAQQDGSVTEDMTVSTLPDLFKVGMIVPCKLMDINKTPSKKKVTLSIDPADVNHEISSINLRHGMCLHGNVSSQEDHGYTIDLGVKGVQAFLKNKDAERYVQMYNEGYMLKVGQCIKCMVMMEGSRLEMLAGANRVVSVAVDPRKIDQVEASASADIAFSSLVAGMKVKASVEKISTGGLSVQFMKLHGTIHKSHLPSGPKAYTQRQQVTCRILYIHPLSKAIVCTLLPHLVNYTGAPVDLGREVKVGDVIDEVKVAKIDKDRGVYFTLKDKLTGICMLTNLSDDREVKINQKFKKGSVHRCRVTGFYLMENLIIITLKESMVDQKYMGISDILPGELIECKLQKIHDKGASVQIRKGINGFIPTMHLADVTLKNPELKFKTGEKMKCRVLFVNKKKSNVTLTHKKSLVNSKYPIITELDQLKAGLIVEGCISSVKDFGCHVRFYNDVEGLVPRPLLSTEPILYPEKVFYRGQVVRCKVVSVNPEDSKLKLTFVLEGKTEFGQREADAPEDFEIGKCVKCCVEKKTKAGLDVKLLPSQKKAFLPKVHLSDTMAISEALMGMYQPGDVIDDVMYLNKSNIILLTRKQSLVQASEKGQLVTEFDQLQQGMMVSGSVKNLMSYGMFIEFPAGIFGLVPNQYALDERAPDLSLLYKQGQSVIAKVVEVNTEKKRFLASLRMRDCFHGDTQTGVQIVKNYLQECETIRKSLHNQSGIKGDIAKLEVGNVYKATIKKKSKQGIICDLDIGVKAVAVLEEKEVLSVAVDDAIEVVLLYIDLKQKCVEVSLCSKLVHDIKIRQNDTSRKLEMAKLSQTLKSKVLLVKEEYILVSLRGHAAGQLAYLPAKRHLNDVLERHQYGVGQENYITIQSTDHSLVLASLTVHVNKQKEEETMVKLNRVQTHNFTLGGIVTGEVRQVHPDQIYLDVNGVHCRVHVTEVLDVLTKSVSCKNPLTSVKVGTEVKVRVIGFRDMKSWKFLSIHSQYLKWSMPECSMRPSILALEDFPEAYKCHGVNMKVGDKLVTYISNYSKSSNCVWTHVSSTVKGKVHVLNMSDDLLQLEHPDKHFPIGCGYNATVINIINDSTVELTFCGKKTVVRPHKRTKCLITCVKNDLGLGLKLAGGLRGLVDLTDLCDVYTDQPTTGYRVGQVVWGHVVWIDGKHKQAHISIRQSRLSPDDDVDITDDEILGKDSLTEGQVLRGFVIKCSHIGLVVRLGHNVSGSVSYDHLCPGYIVDAPDFVFPAGKVVTVKVISLGDVDTDLVLSMLVEDTGVHVDIPEELLQTKPIEKVSEQKRTSSTSSVASEGKKKKTKTKQKATDTDNKENTEQKTDTIKVTANKKNRKISDSEDIADSQSVSKLSKKEKRKRKKSESSETVTESVEESEASDKKKLKKAVKDLEAASLEWAKKQKKTKLNKSDKSVAMETQSAEDSDSGIEIKSANKQQTSEKSVLQLSSGFSWDTEFTLPSGDQSGEISNDDSDNEQDDLPVKKTREQLRLERQEEEKKLFEYERSQLEGKVQPQTADDFDRLVLQSPDSSLVWLRYMAFHLETSEIDKARAVAERALKTISFREEQEKENMWVGYLNLENMYGTTESIGKVLARAIQMCDHISIYTQMVAIYVKSGKIEEAEQLYNRLLKKYSQNKNVWIQFGTFYFEVGRTESARKLLQRALKSLEIKFHVETLTKFAQMEFKYGEPERGKTMYDNILTTYSSRTDLWSVYIDMVTKLGDHISTRSLYNRVINMKFSAKKMKFFFKKYLQFEELHGTDKQKAEVKKKALDYVESQGYVDE